MKTINFLSIVATLVITITAITAFAHYKTTPTKNNNSVPNGKGFAVLELFTSEGCSSCPPADELLAQIQKETNGKPVYILAYHVDYWNSLGWKDIFSKADFTNRQKVYNRQLSVSTYTPQVVINGKAECVGSDEPVLRDAIAQGLAAAPTATINLQAQQQTDKVTLNYRATGVSANDELVIALVQKSTINKIGAGENRGRTLIHAQIVRELNTVNLKQAQGTTDIKLPKGFNPQTWEIVGLVQDKATLQISAAARAEFGKVVNS